MQCSFSVAILFLSAVQDVRLPHLIDATVDGALIVNRHLWETRSSFGNQTRILLSALVPYHVKNVRSAGVIRTFRRGFSANEFPWSRARHVGRVLSRVVIIKVRKEASRVWPIEIPSIISPTDQRYQDTQDDPATIHCSTCNNFIDNEPSETTINNKMADPLISMPISFGVGAILLNLALSYAAFYTCYRRERLRDIPVIFNLLFNFGFHFLYLGGFMIDADKTMIIVLIIWAFLVVLIEVPEWLEARRENIPAALTTTHIFENIQVPTTNAVLVGVGQIILLTYYVWGIYQATPPKFTSARELGFYFSGVAAVLGYSIGKRNDLNEQGTKPAQLVWFILASRYGMACSYSVDGEDAVIHLQNCRWSLLLRYILSVVVNGYGSAALRSFVPLQLASSHDPIQFVLNSVAAMVILEIDNQDDHEYHFVQEQKVGRITLPLAPGSVQWRSKWDNENKRSSTDQLAPAQEAAALVIYVEQWCEGDRDVLTTKSFRILDDKGAPIDVSVPQDSDDQTLYDDGSDGVSVQQTLI